MEEEEEEKEAEEVEEKEGEDCHTRGGSRASGIKTSSVCAQKAGGPPAIGLLTHQADCLPLVHS